MCSSRSWVLGIGVLLVIAMSCAAGEWHHPLSRDGGGIWRQRIPITVTNPTDQALKGTRSVWPLARCQSTRRHAGRVGPGLRLPGQELLFAITDSQALLVTRGPIPSTGFLTIPVECGPRQSATYYVYFDNPSAGELADFLEARRRWSTATWSRATVERRQAGNMMNPTRHTEPPGATSDRNRESGA